MRPKMLGTLKNRRKSGESKGWMIAVFAILIFIVAVLAAVELIRFMGSKAEMQAKY